MKNGDREYAVRTENKDPTYSEKHPDGCKSECIHCNLRKTTKVKQERTSIGPDLFKIEVDHDPAECEKCDENYAVSL